MADVRSMLRSERANRRIEHPHLTYSATGTLTCLICHIQIKSETLWNKHSRSTQHITNSQKLPGHTTKKPDFVTAAPQQRPAGINTSKKRKADDESSEDETRKRTKAEQRSSPTGFSLENVEVNGKPPDSTIDVTVNDRQENRIANPIAIADRTTSVSPRENASPPTTLQHHTTDNINEDEWAAFQRDVATPPPEPTALTATADISAAPLTAAELAAQSREQASRQAREKIEAEVEGEKEDAARQLEEEFEDMAELEDRVRKLKDKREMLRAQSKNEREEGVPIQTSQEEAQQPDALAPNGYASDGETSEDDEEDDWVGWGR